jgi:hypothetical protein
MVDEKWFGDDYLIINEAIFLSEITSYRLRSCLCSGINAVVSLSGCSQYRPKSISRVSDVNRILQLEITS